MPQLLSILLLLSLLLIVQTTSIPNSNPIISVSHSPSNEHNNTSSLSSASNESPPKSLRRRKRRRRRLPLSTVTNTSASDAQEDVQLDAPPSSPNSTTVANKHVKKRRRRRVKLPSAFITNVTNSSEASMDYKPQTNATASSLLEESEESIEKREEPTVTAIGKVDNRFVILPDIDIVEVQVQEDGDNKTETVIEIDTVNSEDIKPSIVEQQQQASSPPIIGFKKRRRRRKPLPTNSTLQSQSISISATPSIKKRRRKIKRLKLIIVTLNLASKPLPPSSLSTLLTSLCGHTSSSLPDLLLINSQETEPLKPRRMEGSRSVNFRTQVVKTLTSSHVPLAIHSLGGVQLLLLIRKSMLGKVSKVKVMDVPCGLGGFMGNKGGIGVYLVMDGKRYLFVGCHLAAHVGNVEERNCDFWRICEAFDKDVPRLSRGENKKETCGVNLFDKIDHVFWCGDLNYRLDLSRNQVMRQLRSIDDQYEEYENENESEEKYKDLLEHDQLSKTIQNDLAFVGLKEAPITFPPTYKFEINPGLDRDVYTREKNRTPSWTDRILFKDDTGRVKCKGYGWYKEFRVSDHRPVYGKFEILDK